MLTHECFLQQQVLVLTIEFDVIFSILFTDTWGICGTHKVLWLWMMARLGAGSYCSSVSSGSVDVHVVTYQYILFYIFIGVECEAILMWPNIKPYVPTGL